MKGQTYVILTIVFVILIAIFAISNVDRVEVTYFFWKVESPLILIILFSVLMGGIVTSSVGALKYVRYQRENKTLREKISQLENKLRENNLLEDEEFSSTEDELS